MATLSEWLVFFRDLLLFLFVLAVGVAVVAIGVSVVLIFKGLDKVLSAIQARKNQAACNV